MKAPGTIAGGDAVGHGDVDRPVAVPPVDYDTVIVAVHLDTIVDGRDGTRTGRINMNTVRAIIGHQRVRDGKIARRVRCEDDAGTDEMTDDAVRDGQGTTSVEFYPRRARTGALDGQAAQADGVSR